jgi:hypothetical protein
MSLNKLLKPLVRSSEYLARLNQSQRREYYEAIKRRIGMRIPGLEKTTKERLIKNLDLNELREVSKKQADIEGVRDIEGKVEFSSVANEAATENYARQLRETGFETKGLSPERINRVYYEEKKAFARELEKMGAGRKEALEESDLWFLRSLFLEYKKLEKEKK